VRGVGQAGGAITIVNALPTGIGCALGVGLFAEAEVTLHPSSRGGSVELHVAPESRTPLVDAAVRGALRQYAPGEPLTVELEIRCEIPPARGLKSSSAVASAIALAVAHARFCAPSALEVALLSAEVSRTSGVSATGALDDALAGLAGGIVITDNLLGRLIRTDPSDPKWAVALLVPGGTHSPSPGWRDAFVLQAREGRAAVQAALKADWWAAMKLNTELVERTMHYEYGAVREGALHEGALGVGVSGLGPALAAVAPQDRMDRVMEALPADLGERRVVPLLTESVVPAVRLA